MTVTFVSSDSVVNTTAGTSVVVPAPAGTVNADVLIAVVGEVGVGTITKPAGWTLIGTQAAGASVTMAAYWALGTVASRTWTLGSSVRNWGWVGAYRGVDPAFPIVVSTPLAFTSAASIFATGEQSSPPHCMIINAITAVAAFTGSATTWTDLGDERADRGTNGGAGTDITGSADDYANTNEYNYLPAATDEFTASQTQSQAVTWTITLNPAFTPYNPRVPLGTIVEAAFGADPDGDATTWTWTDISQYVRAPTDITITKGRADRAGQASPTEIRFQLKNPNGLFTPDNPLSRFFPNVVRNVPIRVSVPYGVVPATERATAHVRSWTPTWDSTVTNPVVSVVARGRLARTRRGADILQSALYRTMRHVTTFAADVEVDPAFYWPCEDGSGSTSAASALGGGPLSPSGDLSFAGSSSLAGSMSLPTFGTTARLVGLLPPYTATGAWRTVFAVKFDAAAGDSTFAGFYDTGTARSWQWRLNTATAPDSLGIRAFDAAGTQILSSEATFTSDAHLYGTWILCALSVTENGADIDYAWVVNDGLVTACSGAGTLAANTHGNITSVAVGPGVASAAGHIAVYTDANVDVTGPDIAGMGFAMTAYNGIDVARTRFTRLCAEEKVNAAYDIYVNDSSFTETAISMGPQPAGSLISALQECADVDDSFFHDGGPLGQLALNTRASRYNAPVSLTLNNQLEQVAPDFAPAFDDSNIQNDVTVSRTGGSSARYVNDACITAEGVQATSVTLNLATDRWLKDEAAWRVNLGCVPGMRYPRLSFSLVASPELVKDWLACRIGSRLAVTHLPPQHPPYDADVFLEGYTEVIGGFTWSVTANCSPARPYDVLQLDATANDGRLDSGGSTLAAGVTATATSLSVATSVLPLWTTTSVPFDILVSGERITVTAVAGAASPQTFTVTRSVNGIAKAQTISAAVELYNPAVLAF